jgi:hypothetical protein
MADKCRQLRDKLDRNMDIINSNNMPFSGLRNNKLILDSLLTMKNIYLHKRYEMQNCDEIERLTLEVKKLKSGLKR